jgi:hypothetical protein
MSIFQVFSIVARCSLNLDRSGLTEIGLVPPPPLSLPPASISRRSPDLPTMPPVTGSLTLQASRKVDSPHRRAEKGNEDFKSSRSASPESPKVTDARRMSSHLHPLRLPPPLPPASLLPTSGQRCSMRPPFRRIGLCRPLLRECRRPALSCRRRAAARPSGAPLP